MERRLDWRPNPAHWALGSTAWRFSATATCPVQSARHSVARVKSIWLDQGQEGACTGFGEEHVMALSPWPQATSNEQARNVYYEARRHDEWPGEDYEGSSVNGAMRAARNLGRIHSWYWARTADESRHGLSYHGAGEMGSWWYSGMWDTDGEGFIHPTGEQVGGHAYAVSGYNWLNGSRYYVIENSWGPGWGRNGQARIWEEDFIQLLNDDGEFAFPRKIRS